MNFDHPFLFDEISKKAHPAKSNKMVLLALHHSI